MSANLHRNGHRGGEYVVWRGRVEVGRRCVPRRVGQRLRRQRSGARTLRGAGAGPGVGPLRVGGVGERGRAGRVRTRWGVGRKAGGETSKSEMSRSRCGGPDRNGQNKPSLRGNGDRPTIMIHDNKLNFCSLHNGGGRYGIKSQKRSRFLCPFLCHVFSFHCRGSKADFLIVLPHFLPSVHRRNRFSKEIRWKLR
jgi:hypothetical protein